MRDRHVRDDCTAETPPQDSTGLDLGGLDLGDGERSRGGPSGGAPATPSPYLESIPKDCDADNSATLEALPCKCKSWFCPDCCLRRGLITRDRLIPVLKTFTGLQMWTLTIDPTLFSTPGLAFQYVRELRCVALLVRGLTKQGKLHTPRFFSVVEWQKESEMPHFHALFDATYIPFSNACDIWNSFRPKSAGPLQGDRPGFGAIRFSASKHKFTSPEHAARYACKYLIKHPEHGYPDWVMKFTGQIHRYTTSHRFWKSGEQTQISGQVECDDAAELDSEPETVKPQRKRISKRRIRTISDRIEECGQTSVILNVIQPRNATESWEYRFVEKRFESVGKIATRLGRSPDKGRLPISFAEWQRLRGTLSTSWRKNDEARINENS